MAPPHPHPLEKKKTLLFFFFSSSLFPKKKSLENQKKDFDDPHHLLWEYQNLNGLKKPKKNMKEGSQERRAPLTPKCYSEKNETEKNKREPCCSLPFFPFFPKNKLFSATGVMKGEEPFGPS